MTAAAIGLLVVSMALGLLGRRIGRTADGASRASQLGRVSLVLALVALGFAVASVVTAWRATDRDPAPPMTVETAR